MSYYLLSIHWIFYLVIVNSCLVITHSFPEPTFQAGTDEKVIISRETHAILALFLY